jgi:multidrug resistance efflux pump
MFDANQIKAQLDAIESTANVAKAGKVLMEWGKENNAMQARLQLYSEKTLFEVARINYQQASNVVEIDRQQGSAIAPAIFQADIAKRDTYKAEMETRADLVREYIRELDRIQPLQTNAFTGLDRAVAADVVYQREQLLQLQKPILLKAPVSGRVTAIFHHAGERVAVSTPILAIASSESRRIVAFVRQPLNMRPKVGDMATVRTRTTRRKVSEAQIVKVGSQLEPVIPMLLPIAKSPVELGLPIALTLPPELELLPGEIVDIKLIHN